MNPFANLGLLKAALSALGFQPGAGGGSADTSSLFEFKGNTDASGTPNYPAGVVGDAYVVTVAGKVGGASGVSVDVGDMYVCKVDNAGGTQVSVGTSWFVLEHNLVGAMLASNNLSDLANAGTARTNLGLGTLATQSGTFSGTSSNTNTGDETTATIKTKLSITTLSGSNTGDQTTVTGNAGTATALQTARAIDGQSFDGTAAITVIAPGTHAATTKATPVDADELPLVDSAASNVLKKLTWANLKATLKTYLDTLYAPITSGTTLLFGNGSGGFTGATGSSVSGANVTLGGTLAASGTIQTTGGRFYGGSADSSSFAQWILDASPYLGLRMAAGNGIWWTASAAGGGNAAIASADSGVSRLGAASLGVGNGSAGDTSGSLTLKSLIASNAASTIGYAAGAGGAVTQLTSRSTGVTLNKSTGAITLFTAAGSATATSFTVTNSQVAATDTINVSVKSSTTNKYLAFVSAVAAGSFEVTFYTTGGTTSDAPVFNFAVLKAAAS